MLENDYMYLVAKIGVDTAENELFQVVGKTDVSHPGHRLRTSLGMKDGRCTAPLIARQSLFSEPYKTLGKTRWPTCDLKSCR